MSEITIDCEINSLNTEYIVNLDNKKYTIDKSECSEPYAILIVYNVMNEYLHKWKMNNWIMSRGQVAAYVDILDGLYDALVQNKISYKMIKK
jgi:hypothetical protein